MAAPLPPAESERLAALHRYQILDTPRELEFDAIARLISNICGTPIAAVNLIAEGRQWFKSEIGLGVRETPLETSICAHAILERDLLVVPDTTRDSRFACNPLVTGVPGLRFYAGALLRSSGDDQPLGTLCVLDVVPRELDAHQLDALRTLASHVMHLLDLRLAKQAADEALAAHQLLLRTVSHDLRTPLGIISLSAQRLDASAPDPATRRVADRIKRASGSMARLVDDLIDRASLVNGALTLEAETGGVEDLIGEVTEFLAPLAEQGGVTLTTAIEPELPAIRRDPHRFRQILTNLVSNALKFTPSGGRVSVRAARLGSALEFVIEDSGVGIPAEALPRLFEPFWRGGGSTARGAGIGLSIVKGLVLAHGGDMHVASEPGAGSRFSFTLPL